MWRATRPGCAARARSWAWDRPQSASRRWCSTSRPTQPRRARPSGSRRAGARWTCSGTTPASCSGAGTFASLGEPNILSYRLSKWALNGLTQIQAAELRGQIAVNALDPGWVKTDLGGPRAPGTVEESARGGLALLLEPFSTTGKLFKDGKEIPY